jgi:hypothetical protein
MLIQYLYLCDMKSNIHLQLHILWLEQSLLDQDSHGKGAQGHVQVLDPPDR